MAMPTFDYKITSINLTNATTNVDTATTYNAATTLRVEVTANDGYHFVTPPYIRFFASGNQTMYTNDEGEYKTSYYFNITQYWIYQMGMTSASQCNFRIYGDAQAIPKSDKYGIIQIYNPTPTELKDISSVRYTTITNQTVNVTDLGEYISSLIRVFVKIPESDKTKVLLGGYDTGVMSNPVIDDVVETNCGTISIVGKYNNAMDYENTTVEIYLPLIGFKTLDTVKVMNETLSLFYRTNVINGDTIACIYNTTGTLLYTFNCRAGFEIPYKMNREDETHGKVDVNSNYLFGFTPFVTVRYNKAYNAAAIAANDDRETTLETLQGYVKCSEVFNTIKATAAEKEEIDNLLKQGVIIT